MQYFIGILLALIPAIVWGYLFYKKSPENRRALLISFVAGVLSVVPMFIWQYNWSFSLNLFFIQIPNINIYQFIRILSHNPSLENVLIFSVITIIISFIIYVSASLFIFIANILLGTSIKVAFRNIIKKIIDVPLIFIATGLLTALCVVILSSILSLIVDTDTAFLIIYGSFWASMMIGFLEEYSKHLVVRFSNENAIYSVNSAIEYSIVVALGFAALENVIYFIDRIWMSPCSVKEIADNACLFNPATGEYMHQVGVILIPFIFRSLLSTLAHVIFSGIFGYFYGVAHFASYELQQIEKNKKSMRIWVWVEKLFRMNPKTVFHELKMIQGLIYAMVLHGLFDFVLDQSMTFLTIPLLFGGYMYLTYLLQKKENQKKLKLILDTKTSAKHIQAAMNNIEMLTKFEENYLQAKKTKKELDQNISLLEKYEALASKKNKLTEIQKNIALLEKYDSFVKKTSQTKEK